MPSLASWRETTLDRAALQWATPTLRNCKVGIYRVDVYLPEKRAAIQFISDYRTPDLKTYWALKMMGIKLYWVAPFADHCFEKIVAAVYELPTRAPISNIVVKPFMSVETGEMHQCACGREFDDEYQRDLHEAIDCDALLLPETSEVEDDNV